MMNLAKSLLSLAFGIGVWLFWWLRYPFELGFQEQNQLFLFTGDYLIERLSVAGGLVDWVAEFITQFYYIPCFGAALIAILMVTLQRLTWKAGEDIRTSAWYPSSFLPAGLMWMAMGDIYVMLSSLVALVGALAFFLCIRRQKTGLAVLTLAIGYWLIGPAVWVTAFLQALSFAICHSSISHLFSSISRVLLWPVSVFMLALAAHYTLLRQYPFEAALWGINYYRIPLATSPLLIAVNLSAVVCPIVIAIMAKVGGKKVNNPSPSFQTSYLIFFTSALAMACGLSWGLQCSFDRGTHELIAYDQLVRQERWGDILKRADKYQPHAAIGCVCINLALFMEGEMADGLDDYWQCGTQGLIMPRIRDFISNVSSYEVFWRLGFVNSALRYAFDSQESIPGGNKSGRHLMRMAECQLVNGNYAVAEKYIDILSQSLFYRRWAMEHRAMLYDDVCVESDRIYGWLRASRFDTDFLYNYAEMDKMLAIIYRSNPNNIMAAQYFKAYSALSTIDNE